MQPVLLRSASLVSSLLLLLSTVSPAFARVSERGSPHANARTTASRHRWQGQSDFTDSPGPVDTGAYPYVDVSGRGGTYTSDMLAAASVADQVEAGTATGPSDPGYIQGGAGDTGDDMVLSGRPNPLPRNVQMTQGDSVLLDYVGLLASIDAASFVTSQPASAEKLQVMQDPNTGRPLPGPGTTPPTYGDAFPWEGSDSVGGSDAAPAFLNTQTGNKLTAMPITSWHAVGSLEMDFELFHNSQDHKDIGWGMNWRSSFDMRVIFSGPNSNQTSQATVSYPSGRQLVYTKSTSTGGIAGTNIYYPPTGFYDALVRVSTGWTLRTLKQMTYVFDSNGYLVSITDRYGNHINIARQLVSGTEYITQVSDAAGEHLSFISQATQTASSPYINHYTSVTAPANQIYTFNYQTASYGNYTILRSVVFPNLATYSSPTETFYYDISAAIVQEIARDGRVYSSAYDGAERLISYSFNVPYYTNPIAQTGSQGNLTYHYSYGSSSTTRTDPFGKTTVDNYDSGTLRSTVDEAGYSETYTYDLSGNVIQYKDARGNTSYYTYDLYSNLTSSQDPRQYTAHVSDSTGYNSWNDVTSTTDSLGGVITYFRDPTHGTVLSVKDELGNTVETNTWNTNGTLASTSSQNVSTSFSYNSSNRVSSITTPNQTYTISYSSQQPWLPTAIMDGLGRQESPEFDNWGRLYGMIRSDNSTCTQGLDPVGHVISSSDYLGNSTSYTYDGAARLVTVQNARGDSEQYTYADLDRVVKATDGNGHARTTSYTVRGEAKSVAYADGTGYTDLFDGNGNATSHINGLGQQNYTAYDVNDNLAGITYPDGTTVSCTYDLEQELLSEVDSSGTQQWMYDLAGNLTKYSSPQGSVTYSYDGWERETQADEGSGVKVQYAYSGDRVASITKQPENEVTSFGYDSIGRLTSRTNSNGTVESYTFDGLDRLSSTAVTGSGGASIFSESYGYDTNDNLTTETSNGQSTTYTYDSVGQLLTEVAPSYSVRYSYDHNGNRTNKWLNNGAPDQYTYDSGDKLTSIVNNGLPVKNFTYDGEGRMTAVTSYVGTTTLAYDFENRLLSVAMPNVNNSFAYNGFNTRVKKVDSSGSTSYLRDGEQPDDDVLQDTTSAYVPGISRHTSTGTNVLHADNVGTVRVQTNSSQGVAVSRTYDAFGLLQSSNYAAPGIFGFAGGTGYEEDSDSGLKLLGNRYYDASTGRFLTRDPSEDGRNSYNYCSNNPLGYVDPEGLSNNDIGGRARKIATDPQRKKAYKKKHSGTLSYESEGEDREAPAYTDCGTFVGETVGPEDDLFPKNSTGPQSHYLSKSPRWERADPKHPQPGDVAVEKPYVKNHHSHVGHIMVRGDDGYWYDASLGSVKHGGHEPRRRKGGPDKKHFKTYRHKQKPKKKPKPTAAKAGGSGA